MYIARILYPVEVLGPGKRIGIWFCGCPRRCEGCSNPELWEFQKRYQVSQERVMQMIHKIADHYPVDGFTLTGGDPLFQFDACMKLIQELKTISPDILVYSGYTFDELLGKDLASDRWAISSGAKQRVLSPWVGQSEYPDFGGATESKVHKLSGKRTEPDSELYCGRHGGVGRDPQKRVLFLNDAGGQHERIH